MKIVGQKRNHEASFAIGRFAVALGAGGLMFLIACATTETKMEKQQSVRQATADQTESVPPELIPATGPEILAAVRESKATAVLVNVWATWCQPCREEFPDLVRVQRDYQNRGLEMIFVSADFDTQVKEAAEFLAAHGVVSPTYIKTGNDMEFINTLSPDWSGALPATFIYDRNRVLRHFWVGKASYERFEKNVLEVLQEVK